MTTAASTTELRVYVYRPELIIESKTEEEEIEIDEFIVFTDNMVHSYSLLSTLCWDFIEKKPSLARALELWPTHRKQFLSLLSDLLILEDKVAHLNKVLNSSDRSSFSDKIKKIQSNLDFLAPKKDECLLFLKKLQALSGHKLTEILDSIAFRGNFRTPVIVALKLFFEETIIYINNVLDNPEIPLEEHLDPCFRRLADEMQDWTMDGLTVLDLLEREVTVQVNCADEPIDEWLSSSKYLYPTEFSQACKLMIMQLDKLEYAPRYSI